MAVIAPQEAAQESERAAEVVADEPYRKAIEELFSQLSIERVILVDDAIDVAESDDAIASLIAAIPSIRKRLAKWARTQSGVLTGLGDELMDDANVTRLIETEWAGLDARVKLELLALRLKRTIKSAALVAGDAQAIEGLGGLLPAGVQIEFVKAADWVTARDTLFPAGYPHTLLFFDRDLGLYGGGAHAGDVLIEQMRGRGLSGVYFGLFTNAALTPEREMAIVDELLPTTTVAVSVMAKFRAGAIEKFAEGLRVFLYTTDLQQLRKHTLNAMKESFAAAEAFLEELGFHSLMASAEAARYEGAYEPDGPLRMVRANLRRSLEAQLRASTPAAEFARIRDASKLIIATGSRQSSSLAELEWNERFDSAEHLTSCHLPLEVGDIFEVQTVDESTEYYMLLVQSCDLMVRSRGKRAHSPLTFTLAKLVIPEAIVEEQPETEEGQAVKKKLPDRYRSVGRFKWESEQDWVIDLTKRISLFPELLDACVLTDDGGCVLSQSMVVPMGMSQGWENRVAKLDAWRKGKVAEARRLTSLLPSDFTGGKRAKVVTALSGGVLGLGSVAGGFLKQEIDIKNNCLSASIRRHSRLVEDHAKALLLLSSQYQARADTVGELFDHGDHPGR